MSGNKMTDSKITEDVNTDSGFLSGPLDVLPGDEDTGELVQIETTDSTKCDDKVQSDSQALELDSGILLSECLSDLKLIDFTTKTEASSVRPQTNVRPQTSVRPQTNDLPLELLFEQDDDGDTQLHIAAVHGCQKSVSTLIRVCPNKDLLNTPNDYGQTALHLAVLSKNPIVTRMLVVAGASIAIRDRRGETPLHKATALCHIKCIQALLTPVPEHPQRNLSAVVDQKNYNGQACVHVAASLGHLDTLQTLLHYKADINATENLAGWTALHIAASRGDARLVAWLQRAGADARARDYASRSPRRVARRSPAAAAAAAALFTRADDSDTDSDSDDDMFDDETTSLFEKFSTQNQSIVA